MRSDTKIYSGLIAIIVIAVYSCAPALYNPLPEHASAAVSFEQLVKGREIYVNSCGSCHTLYQPHRFTEEVWIKNVDEMQERSKINDAEKALLLAYLKQAPANK